MNAVLFSVFKINLIVCKGNSAPQMVHLVSDLGGLHFSQWKLRVLKLLIFLCLSLYCHSDDLNELIT